MQPVKYLFDSKTIVFNLIVALAGVIAFFWTPATEWVQSNAVLIMAVVGAANMILRRVTKDAYAFFPIMVAMLCLSMLPSCVNSYQVDGTGYDWKTNPIQKLPASRVIPIVDVPLPSELGGGTVEVPITIQPTK